MKNFILIILLLFIGCASNVEASCENSGMVDFMYINVPCDDCIPLIENIFKNNSNIFSYDIMQNRGNHIIINYCYNYKKITPQDIEKIILDNNFPINNSITSKQAQYLQNLCCNSQ